MPLPRSLKDAHRDSGLVSDSPLPPAKTFAEQYARDSGIILDSPSSSRRVSREPTEGEGIRSKEAQSQDPLSRLSWPPVDDMSETVDLDRASRQKRKKEESYAQLSPQGIAKAATGLGIAGVLEAPTTPRPVSRSKSPFLAEPYEDGKSGHVHSDHRSFSDHRRTPDLFTRRQSATPDPTRSRPASVLSNRSVSGGSQLGSALGRATPPLRRSGKKVSGDLRSLSQKWESTSQLSLVGAKSEAGEAGQQGDSSPIDNTTNDKQKAKDAFEADKNSSTGSLNSETGKPNANEGRVRVRDMAEVFVSPPLQPSSPTMCAT